MPKIQFATGTAQVTVDYGYDIHSICFSGRTLRRIQRGSQVTLLGQGFHVDGVRTQDIWSFNAPDPGDLRVDGEDGREIYLGDLESAWISLEGAN